MARGGRISLQQVATDAFGNALGESLAAVNTSGSRSYQDGDIARSELRWRAQAQDNPELMRAFVDSFRTGAGVPVDRSQDVLWASAGTIYSDAGGGRDRLKLSGDDSVFAEASALAAASSARRVSQRSAWLAAEAQATSALYASGAGDIRETIHPDAPTWTPWTTGGEVKASYTGSSMAAEAAEVALKSAISAATDLITTPLDLVTAGIGAMATLATGRAFDVPMFSSIGRAAQAGTPTGELLMQMNPMYALPVALHDIATGWEQGDTRPLAALSGSLLGGSLLARGTVAMPGYQASTASVTGLTAERLQQMGVPDWNIRFVTPKAGTLYSNPLPLKLEKINPTNRVGNLTEAGTLQNLRPNDPVYAQRTIRTLIQDTNGRYWLEGPSGNRITPSGKYDFVTMPDGVIRISRQNPNPEFSTHLGLSNGFDVKYAGSIRFANNSGPQRGTMTKWSNDSGHFQPPVSLGENALLPMNLFKPR